MISVGGPLRDPRAWLSELHADCRACQFCQLTDNSWETPGGPYRGAGFYSKRRIRCTALRWGVRL